MTGQPLTRVTWRSVLRFIARMPARVLLVLLRGYQLFISPLTPPTCRFYPSCSQYAVLAVTRHGALHGTRLAAWRLLRCNPWNPGGVDDVPPAHDRHSHHLPVASATS
jgi:putative membrane protein insertion efficiency factor